MYMKTATFTSTISPELISWLDRRAKAEKRTRRAMLEEAIRLYKRDIARETLKEGFARAARDPDMIEYMVELAEWGMGDYAKLIERT